MAIDFEELREWMHFDEAADFMALFAYFEHQLKAKGFVYPEQWAKPHWKDFREKQLHHAAFEQEIGNDEELRTAYDYIFNAQPKVQKAAVDGTLSWEDEPSKFVVRLEIAVDLVVRVRNNLFHGGKFEMEDDSERNRMLIGSSLTILTSCLRLGQGFMEPPTTD